MLVSRVVIDSSGRNANRYPDANDFEIDLSELSLDDVIELRLVYAALPTPEPHLTRGRNLIYINDKVCNLTRGMYAHSTALCRELTLCLRRDLGPAFFVYPTNLGRVGLQSFTPFTVKTTGDIKSKDRRGFTESVPLVGSAASILGFTIGPPQQAIHVGNKYFAIADNTALSTVDEVVIVRISNVCGIKSNATPFDRAFAVLHHGRALDPLPTTHANDPPRVSIKSLRIKLVRRDGTPYDTDGKDLTLHLDIVKGQPYR